MNPNWTPRTKTAAALAAAVLSLAVLTGCEPVVGTVVDKEHEKGEWENKTRQKCQNAGGKQKCSTETYRQWDGEDWVLVVEDSDGKEHEIEVSEKTYDSHEVGSHFDESKS